MTAPEENITPIVAVAIRAKMRDTCANYADVNGEEDGYEALAAIAIVHLQSGVPALLEGLDAADEEIVRLRALLGECKAQLLGLEFSGYDFDDGAVCPECGGCNFHKKGCGYTALLAKVREVTS